MKTDIILLADVFGKFTKMSSEEYGNNRIYCVSICSYKYQCRLKFTGNALQTLQVEDMILI